MKTVYPGISGHLDFCRRLMSLVLLVYPFSLKAQMLKGYLVEEGTHKKIAHGSVYFQSMPKGTTANADGYFEISVDSTKYIPIIVSALGYYATELNLKEFNRIHTVSLKPKVYELAEVTVNGADGMSRKKKVELFRSELLGETKNGRNCQIVNLDKVDLRYNKARKVLTAYCDEPIEVISTNLAYKILFSLNHFSVSEDSVSFEGYCYFQDLINLSRLDSSTIYRNRKAAYLGSKMHFVRSLWRKELRKNGFTVYDRNYKPIAYEDLVVESDSNKFLYVDKVLQISHIKGLRKYASGIVGQNDFALIDPLGYYDYNRIDWTGYVFRYRLGDLLPYDYHLIKAEK